MAAIPDKSIERIIAEALGKSTAINRPTVWNVRQEDTQTGNVYESSTVGDYWSQWMYGTRADAVKGTDNADYINSGAGNDVIWGLGGNDILDGGYGHDIIISGNSSNGHTALYGGEGNDLLVGGYDLTIGQSSSSFIDTWRSAFSNVNGLSDASLKAYFTENTSRNYFSGGDGNDTIIGSSGNNTVDGGEGHDLIIMGNGANEIVSGGGNDTIMVGDGANDIKAGDGNDVILVGTGQNTIDGGDGVDILGFQNSTSGVYANLDQVPVGEYTVIGNTSFKNIEGFHGSQYNDTLFGDRFDNFFDGGGGQDSIDGRGGNDTLSFGSAEQGVNVNIGLGTAVLEDGTSLGSFINIENIVGSAFNDTLVGDSGDNRIDVNGGGRNIVAAGAGNDTIVSGFETVSQYEVLMANTIDGGEGFDIIDYSNGPRGLQVDLSVQKTAYFTGLEWVLGDSFTGIEGVKGHLSAGDTLIAGSTGNFMDGQGGDDLLVAGAGADTLIGGEGRDTVTYDLSTSGVSVNLKTGQAGGGYAEGDVLSGFEGIVGSNHDDSIVGSDGGTFIRGLAGNDTLIGGNGNDTIEVGTGSNYAAGGAGNDKFISSGGGNNVFDGGEGNDTVSYELSETGLLIDMSGQGVNGDRLISIEQLTGSKHADTIYGSDQSETINGGGGADMIYGSAGADLIIGAGGSSTINYSLSDAAVSVNLRTGVVSGGHAEGDTIQSFFHAVGSAYDDTLVGHGTSSSKLVGGAGNDVLTGGSGGDLLDGGEGLDIVDYSNSNQAVTVDLTQSYASGGHATRDTLIGIEGVIGSLYNDRVTAGPNAGYFDLGLGNDSMVSGAGADTMEGGVGTDTLSYAASTAAVNVNLTTGTGSGGYAEGDVISGFESVTGSAYNDTLTGSAAGSTTLDGGNGNDYFHGSAGATYFIGGAGNDTVDYSNSTAGVTVSGTRGSGGYAEGDMITGVEAVVGSQYDDYIYVTGNNLTLSGGAGNDTLCVNGGYNLINGGDGQDVISYENMFVGSAMYADFRTGEMRGGQLNNDTLISIEGIIGGIGNDTFHGGNGASYIGGGYGNDQLYSHGANTTLNGGAGNDTLYGSEHSETLLGGDGNDVIMLSGGSDYIDGGAGVDSISYALAAEGVMVNLTTGEASGGFGGNDTIFNVEAVIGSSYNDTMYGSQATGDTLDGGAGDDYFYASSARNSIQGGAGIDTVDYSLATLGVTVALDGYGSGGALGDTIMGVEALVGSSFNDSLTGSTRNDTLMGGAGNDTLIGGVGADYLDGGEGSDWTSYVTSNAGVNVNLATGAASGGHAAGDTLVSIENVIGSNYNDTIIGNAEDNNLTGNNGNDSLLGGAGNDTLIGGVGNDTLDGGDGFDIADYALSNQAININLATGAASGGHAAGDKLISIEGVIGSNYNDTVTGSADANYIATGAGNDLIFGSAGADTIDGGAGSDTISYANSNAGVYVNLATGEVRGGHAEGDVLSNIEVILGSAYSDTMIGTSGNDTFYGSGGGDHFDGGAGTNLMSYADAASGVGFNMETGGFAGIAEGDTYTNIQQFRGSAHNDTIVCGDSGSWVDAGYGNDHIYSGAGKDYIYDSSGIDTVDYSRSDAGVSINLQTGAYSGGYAQGDTLTGIEGVIGSDFDDILIGKTNTSNTLIGGAGNDWIRGTTGTNDGQRNYLDGGDGNDTLVASRGVETIVGGAGFDIVDYQYVNSAVSINLATGVTGGDASGDVLSGIEGVAGSRFADTIVGDAENNLIYGAGGSNTLTGGAGADTFGYNYDYKGAVNWYARDVITDFSEADGDQLLIYSKTGTGTVGYKDGGAATAPNSAITGYFEGHNVIVHNTSDLGTILMVDVNGDGNWGVGDVQIKLDGVDSFNASSITWTDQQLKL